ncbi:hypothetical protein GCM10007415_16440 [Parapedobacter pyrenivorans]|uniref:MG2 domain-containing protein n=1 Tax=Parapedobacter pyrenivorans TaxID=1305674 RepID=A0A917M9S2_9SPHI|nr:carboxypeptidase-like regulatory domain-containing protein [Parapedobacter pyrenivorans]GGG84005.1 hypothetical protein GCM10007415_16440 [Parapedobacter pyrenivorans]
MRIKYVGCLLLWCAVVAQLGYGQSNSIDSLVSGLTSFRSDFPREKLFIHRDRSDYLSGDTLWYRGYVLRADTHVPGDSIDVAYVEVIDGDDKVVKRVSAPGHWGGFSGRIVLDEGDYAQGEYTLRAYTNWMRNYGDTLLYVDRFRVVDPKAKGWRAPVSAFSEGGLDVQFLPEGGSFVSGFDQRLGFKTLDAYGNGADIKGVIVDDTGKEIRAFASAHRGMGVVDFTPEAGVRYTAVLDDGSRHALPEVELSGTMLRVVSDPGSDSVTVVIDATPDLHGRVYHFTAEARESVGIRGSTPPLDGPYVRAFPKSLFPSGVIRFTAYDSDLTPLNGRSVFVWHGDDLNMQLNTNRAVYGTRDSVGLTLRVRDADGRPIPVGSFSVAVLDTGQVAFDAYGGNLLSYMLLGAELRGRVEDPYYYIKHPDSPAMDALLLTQGWVRYVRRHDSPVFSREKGYSVAGRVVDALGRPIKNSGVTLLARMGSAGALVQDTSANTAGAFRFDGFGPFITDTVSMVLKALNKRNWDYGIRVELDEPSFPALSAIGWGRVFTPGLLLADTVSRRLVESRARVLGRIDPGSIMLEEAVVTAQAQIPGSKNLNKGGGADQVIPQKLFEDTPKKTLFDLIHEQVDGFGMRYVEGTGEYIPRTGALSRGQVFTVGTNYARFIIDGVALNQFYYPPGEYLPPTDPPTLWLPTDETLIEDFDPKGYMDYLRPYLEHFRAEDILGMEVMSSMRYKSRYQSRHLGIKENVATQGIGPRGLAFIEITTRLGTGPFLNKIPGEYRFRPLVPVVSPEFYSPKYTSPEREGTPADTRATLYWNPEVLVDKNGEAEFSFYTSDNAGGYVVVVQGTDLFGGIGVLHQYLDVKNEAL